MTLERLWLAAWLEGLQRQGRQPAVRPVEPPAAPGKGYVPPAPRSGHR